MTTTRAPSKPPLAAIPARYAKFIAAVLGEAIAYVQLYGTTWHLDAALVMAGAALGVLGVPNAALAPRPVAAPPAGVPGTVTITPPAVDRPTGGITP